jgi:hypothetical protein
VPTVSRHRSAVVELADAMASLAMRELSDSSVQELRAQGQCEFRVGTGHVAGSGPASRLSQALLTLVDAAGIQDLHEAHIEVVLMPGERIGRCVGGSALTTRRLAIVDVAVKATVKTRWVHLWAQLAATRQWALA